MGQGFVGMWVLVGICGERFQLRERLGVGDLDVERVPGWVRRGFCWGFGLWKRLWNVVEKWIGGLREEWDVCRGFWVEDGLFLGFYF